MIVGIIFVVVFAFIVVRIIFRENPPVGRPHKYRNNDLSSSGTSFFAGSTPDLFDNNNNPHHNHHGHQGHHGDHSHHHSGHDSGGGHSWGGDSGGGDFGGGDSGGGGGGGD
ncbi:hypothetical protein PaeBR_06580 [Paenibacillus sp. BR2-3]|uniref:hypothetical protein n=1 Tax=Paenibacillus sp. BR2-3 TaxID=3048494 RepID=UPI003977BD7D